LQKIWSNFDGVFCCCKNDDVLYITSPKRFIRGLKNAVRDSLKIKNDSPSKIRASGK